jgi:hypothetical protein
MYSIDFPSELEFLEFFGAEPSNNKYVVAYTYKDPDGNAVKFSFDSAELSVHTIVFASSGLVLCKVSHENMIEMKISEDVLRCEFRCTHYNIVLTLSLTPHISVMWNGLQV